MNREVEYFDPSERAREKQASRDADARALASGQKSSEDLRGENAFLSDDLIARSTVNLSAIRW